MPRPGGMQVAQKSKDFKGSIKRLIKNLKPWRKLLVLSLVLAMVSAILSLVSPNYISDLTDIITEGIKPNITETTFTDIMKDPSIPLEDKQELQNMLSSLEEDATQNEMLELMDELPSSIYNKIEPQMNMTRIKNIGIFLGILYLLSVIFSYVQQFAMTTISNSFAKSLRTKISKKINLLPLSYFDHNEMGDILSRITNDVDTIAQNLNQSLATLVSSLTLFLCL